MCALSSAAIQSSTWVLSSQNTPCFSRVVIKKKSVCLRVCKTPASMALNLLPCEEFLKNCMSVYYFSLQLQLLGE